MLNVVACNHGQVLCAAGRDLYYLEMENDTEVVLKTYGKNLFLSKLFLTTILLQSHHSGLRSRLFRFDTHFSRVSTEHFSRQSGGLRGWLVDRHFSTTAEAALVRRIPQRATRRR